MKFSLDQPLKKNPFFWKHKLVKFKNYEGEELYEVVWFTDYGTSKQEINLKTFPTLLRANTYINKRIGNAKVRLEYDNNKLDEEFDVSF